jgi:hypothetical protein
MAGAGGAAVLVTRGFASTMAAHLVQQAACPLQVAARVSHQHGRRVRASRLTRLELARLQWAMVGDARCCCSRSRRHVLALPSVAADSHHTLHVVTTGLHQGQTADRTNNPRRLMECLDVAPGCATRRWLAMQLFWSSGQAQLVQFGVGRRSGLCASRAFLRVCSLPLERLERREGRGAGHRQTRHEARATTRPPDRPTTQHCTTQSHHHHRASPLARCAPLTLDLT